MYACRKCDSVTPEDRGRAGLVLLSSDWRNDGGTTADGQSVAERPHLKWHYARHWLTPKPDLTFDVKCEGALQGQEPSPRLAPAAWHHFL
jgi:hypothetical protein